MDIINGKMVVTEPQEFDLAKAQILELENHCQNLQQTTQQLIQKIVLQDQALDRAKNQIDILENRSQQTASGIKTLTQQQTTLNQISKAWSGIPAETKALHTKNGKLFLQLGHQRTQQQILAIATALTLVSGIAWTEWRIAGLRNSLQITQGQIY
jgi:chromosome segregation ATPase